MAPFCIMDTDDGWTIVEHPPDMTAEETAHRQGGTVIDAGPYETYAEADDALVALQLELADEDSSDVPGTQTMEDRSEIGD